MKACFRSHASQTWAFHPWVVHTYLHSIHSDQVILLPDDGKARALHVAQCIVDAGPALGIGKGNGKPTVAVEGQIFSQGQISICPV